jgi:hypothetical protein
VHALPEFDLLALRQEAGDDPVIARPPRRAAVVRNVDAGSRDRDQQTLAILGMHQHGMEAEPATARLPLGAMGMVPQAFDQRERAAAVVAAEQCRRLDAGVHHVGFVTRAGRELPDPRQRGIGALGEAQRRLFVLGPAPAEIVGASQHRPPVVADRSGEQPRRTRAGVDAGGIHLLARERRTRQFEVLTAVAGPECEQALGRAEQDEYVRPRDRVG